MVKWGCAVAALMVGALPMAAHAQEQPTPPATPADPAAPATPQQTPPEAEEEPVEDVVVRGQLRGAVPGDVKPEIQLGPADIRAYGASNVTELMNALSAQLGSGSGRGDEQPVILLSGRRSSMAEIRNLPTEAIERMDILPEEAALQYGYGANQKVVNFVLRRRFMGLTTLLEGAMPTAGGNSWQNGNVNLQKIRRDERLELDVKYSQNSGILESERGVTRAGTSLFDTRGNIVGLAGDEIDPALSALAGTLVTVAGVPSGAAGAAPTLAGFAANANQANVADLTPYRTLTGGGGGGPNGGPGFTATPQKRLEISGSYTPAISDKVSANATFGLVLNHSDTLLGLPSATLRLPTGNPFSPFSQDVRLLRYYDNLDPLSRSSDNRTLSGGLTFNSQTSPWLASWGWSLQANYEYGENNSVTTTGIDATQAQALLDARDPGFNPFGPLPRGLAVNRPDQISKSVTNNASVDFTTFGSLFKLPAGDVRATVRVAGRSQDQDSRSWIAGRFQAGDISRDTGSVRGNLTLPLTSRSRGVLGAIGELSINGNLEVEQLSDFGRLVSTGYGLNWTPIREIRANISINDDRGAPSPAQLGNPILVTPNRRVFDFVRNESVDITAITGGNPLLRADSRHVFNARVTIRPLAETDLNIRASYSNQRYRNYAGTFPGATAEIEAAFPDRFVRDADGRLLSIDYRPVNFERRDTSQLRWGIDFSIPISSPQAKRMQERRTAFQAAMAESRRTGQPLPPEMSAQLEQFRRLGQQQSLFGGNQRRQGDGPGQQQGQGPGQGQPPQDQGRERGEGQGPGAGGGFRGGPGGGGRGFGGGGGGRGGFGGGGNLIRFSLNHAWVFKDEVLIRRGLPVIDRLDGSSSQGVAAHQIDALAALKRDAWLFQVTGNWRSGTRQMTGPIGSQTRLNFGSLARVGLLTEFNPGQNIDFLLKNPWLRGSRVQLRVDNLFDARQRVTDENGEVPSAYAPNLVDPLGRVVRLTFRKQFF
ncbi:MAG: TonB-dependent receptor [Sphingomonas sp.]|uniref:TonB-dependent receptor n=1 Tax=Sphingomonas sp. TaxID=28214 RepID=UPI0022749F0E|nr:TonB-dependent receptor [Sphingomonas sp.]MCX8477695.1 TonB-dependent receptor [Sphingomonas sp.]